MCPPKASFAAASGGVMDLAPLADVADADNAPEAAQEDPPEEPAQDYDSAGGEQELEQRGDFVHTRALVTAATMASACCFIAASDSASTITRQSVSVPE